MQSDLIFCMNSYLTYRAIVDHERRFADRLDPWFYRHDVPREGVNTAEELDRHLRKATDRALKDGPVALMLSSGMDSAILAAYLPKGTVTYTLHCHAESDIDETAAAKRYAERNGLKHKVVDVYWSDYEKYALPLMKRKGCPIHSLEVQVYKAALRAKADGIKTLIFGETADILYGGHSQLLSRDWTLEEFTKRFSFVDVTKVLRHPKIIRDPILPHVNSEGNVDVFGFLNRFEYDVSLGFYNNACRLAEINFFAPYSGTFLGHPLDLARIRGGESKYVVRELFRKIYPDLPVPSKTPLPRPMAQWLKDWTGPLHRELLPDHIPELTGDQKWYVYALNQFLTEFIGESNDAVPENRSFETSL